MLINADFSRRAAVTPDQYQWVASPLAGVERVMLDRVGREKARATSIVRYAPNSYFAAHQHPDGEEIFVLSGTFSDEGGDYPAGCYLRNPPGSLHQPFSMDGTIIFVKLGQMLPGGDHPVRVDTRDPSSWRHEKGRAHCPLFSGKGEQVSLQRLAAGQSLLGEPASSIEILVLEGDILVDGSTYAPYSWIRLPEGDSADILAGPEGATVYMKLGRPANTGKEASR